MTTENPFKGREFGDRVFATNHDRCLYIGFNARQREKWLRDHPELWKTREDALRDLQARARTDVEAEPAEACSTTSANDVRPSGEPDGPLPVQGEDKPVPGEDKRQPDKPATNAAPLTIANPEATATAGNEIIIGERRFITERRVAATLGCSPRTLQRWRTEGKGPPSTKIGRKVVYEINELQEWIERQKNR